MPGLTEGKIIIPFWKEASNCVDHIAAKIDHLQPKDRIRLGVRNLEDRIMHE